MVTLPTPYQRSYVKRILSKEHRPLVEVISSNLVIVLTLALI